MTSNFESMLSKVVSQLRTSAPQVDVGCCIMRGDELILGVQDDIQFPTASSIKPALLQELMAQFGERQEQWQAAARAVLHNRSHPAMRPFAGPLYAAIRSALDTLDLAQLGHVMIRGRDGAGNRYSNAAYNAATNVAIAVLGGPEDVTRKLHARGTDQSVQLNRYMLAARDITGDNVATPHALVQMWRQLADANATPLPSGRYGALMKILLAKRYPDGLHLYFKEGNLNSDPITEVRAGYFSKDERAVYFAVMLRQSWTDATDETTAAEQHERLTRHAHAVVDCIRQHW